MNWPHDTTGTAQGLVTSGERKRDGYLWLHVLDFWIARAILISDVTSRLLVKETHADA
jgi:hypothetical protein